MYGNGVNIKKVKIVKQESKIIIKITEIVQKHTITTKINVQMHKCNDKKINGT
jgi:hypothetical protein